MTLYNTFIDLLSVLCFRSHSCAPNDLTELLTTMKQSLDNVSEKLTGIATRMESFEVQQRVLEEELKDLKSAGCSASTNPKSR